MERRTIQKHSEDETKTICQVTIPNDGSVSVIEVTNQQQKVWFQIPIDGRMYIKFPFAICEPCQKQFNGREPYEQHLKCAKHERICGSRGNRLPNDICIKILSKASL
ncbi:hypothetical protein TNCT_71111 [Trichonephila clavata]|uniref:C2H2-type domain-containing protein n=1 Tax=Trichonephila clavata TaxID=2740835 RepID=A0A8X6FIZ9_TRICU|nr:hypothetical protein TNCT_71111 [Trichonephila clavata]